jgi:hypothetical protein
MASATARLGSGPPNAGVVTTEAYAASSSTRSKNPTLLPAHAYASSKIVAYYDWTQLAQPPFKNPNGLNVEFIASGIGSVTSGTGSYTLYAAPIIPNYPLSNPLSHLDVHFTGGPNGYLPLPIAFPFTIPWSDVAAGAVYPLLTYADSTADIPGGTLSSSIIDDVKSRVDPGIIFDQATFDAWCMAQGLVAYNLSDYFQIGISPNVIASNIPEPFTLLLLGSGLIGLAGYGRKKFFKK